MGLLIPMPVVWVWDWTMIAADWYHVTVRAVSHSLFALWGAMLFSIGFIKILELRALPALLSGIGMLISLFLREYSGTTMFLVIPTVLLLVISGLLWWGRQQAKAIL